MKRALAILLVATAAPAGAQTTNDQLWPDLFVTGTVTRGVVASGEVITRLADDANRLGQFETRLEVGHPLSRKVTVWAGWVHLATYAKTGRNGIENQAVEQVNWNSGRLGRLVIGSRTRLEQRFIRDTPDTSWRLREQVRLALPITRGGASLVLWGEPFLALGHTRSQAYTLERTRGFVGVNVPVAKHLDFETGYLNEYLHRPTGDVVNHVLPLVLSVRY